MSTLLLAPSQLDFSSGFSKNYLIKPFEDILPAKEIEADVEPVRKRDLRDPAPAAYFNRNLDKFGWDKAAIRHDKHPLFSVRDVQSELGCDAHFENAVKGARVQICLTFERRSTPAEDYRNNWQPPPVKKLVADDYRMHSSSSLRGIGAIRGISFG